MAELIEGGGDDSDDDDDEICVTPSSLQVIKRGSRFLAVYTDQLTFLDMVNFLAPGCSYAQYLKAFGAPQEKFFFPYEHIKSVVQLEDRGLPPKEAFYSTLKKTGITDEDYAHCQQVSVTHSTI